MFCEEIEFEILFTRKTTELERDHFCDAFILDLVEKNNCLFGGGMNEENLSGCIFNENDDLVNLEDIEEKLDQFLLKYPFTLKKMFSACS